MTWPLHYNSCGGKILLTLRTKLLDLKTELCLWFVTREKENNELYNAIYTYIYIYIYIYIYMQVILNWRWDFMRCLKYSASKALRQFNITCINNKLLYYIFHSLGCSLYKNTLIFYFSCFRLHLLTKSTLVLYF